MLERILSFVSSPAFAQTSGQPLQLTALAPMIDRIFDFIFPIGVVLAVAMIIYGGYMWIISGGDPSRKQAAQGTLTWAVIGLVFLFLIRAVLLLVVDIVF